MTQSVELLLASEDEDRVLAQWRALEGAGLPNQSRHRAASNRPHVTVVAVASIDEQQQATVEEELSERLPLTARLGGLVLFGRAPVVAARLVVATAGLLALHRAVADAVDVAGDSLSAPGRWVPHVTLAHRLSPEQLARAVDSLPAREEEIRFVGARRWDSGARVETRLC